MAENDFEIGPCRTYPDFRGRGIYPIVIDHIVHNYGGEDTTFYMSVSMANTSSVRGIEKAGFEKYKQVEKKGLFKIYHVID